MPVFIAADHRGLELKNKLVEHLQEQNIRIDDFGAYTHDPQDDYPDYANKVVRAVLQNPQENMGIVICGSGIGVSIAANRHKSIRCGLAITPEQVKHGKENDHINILALGSDFITAEVAKNMVDLFLQTAPVTQDRFMRRIHKLDDPVAF